MEAEIPEYESMHHAMIDCVQRPGAVSAHAMNYVVSCLVPQDIAGALRMLIEMNRAFGLLGYRLIKTSGGTDPAQLGGDGE